MRYTLFASEEEWKRWHVKLGKFSDYYDKASRVRALATPRNQALPTPQFNMPPNLPSPPVSQHTSPPYSTNPSGATISHPLSMPPYLPPTMPSPVIPKPEIDPKLWTRKRSLEDSSSEQASKRLSSLGPSTGSNATLTPSTLKDTSSPTPRLPMPNLSISTGNHYNGNVPPSAQLPVPAGRAMSAVFPGPNRWPQNGILPSLQPPSYFSHPGSAKNISPMSEQPPRQSPYTNGSATPSPTSLSFPQHHTPNGLSPSGFPAPRNSPYKPIRSVNTLLVPPASKSVHHATQNLSYDQMHYQPLGKPISERKTGVLPYLPFDTWSQSHHMQHYLPQPNFAS